ncbi:MAG: DUF63 family protein [Candidatus Thermoplasmatota archaeon]|nr:DUF63 family protein [Candidatus Thermoplasmatota archaeon]
MERRTRIEISIAAVFVGVAFIIALGCWLFPDLFWERFVWKYYWAPIVADAGGDAGGATSSYNWVDTLTYGFVLAGSIYCIYRLFGKLDLRMGTGLFLAMSPVIVIGSTARVLEDMELFREPLRYLFISPLIYIFLGLCTLGTVIIAWFMERSGKRERIASDMFLFLPGLTVSLTVAAFPDWFSEAIPIVPILIITLLVVLLKRFSGSSRYETTAGLFWLQMMLFVCLMYVLWIMKGDWYNSYIASRGGDEPNMHLPGGAGVIGLVALSTLVVCACLKVAGRSNGKIERLLTPVNIMIITGHMTDASATFAGIDLYGYTEKHVLPSRMMEMVDSTGFPYPGLVMYPLKLVFLIPALYIMDISMERESRDDPHLLALVKLTVLVLGFAPGIRDLTRLAFGV